MFWLKAVSTSATRSTKSTRGDNYEVLDVGHGAQYGREYSEQLTMDAVLKHAEAA